MVRSASLLDPLPPVFIFPGSFAAGKPLPAPHPRFGGGGLSRCRTAENRQTADNEEEKLPPLK